MAKAYSMDLRKRVIAACESGMSVQDAATVYRITARTIFDWLRRKRETGSFAPKTGKPGPRNKLANHLDTLREIIRDQPDATLREIRDRLPVRVGIMTISRALTSLNITLKKSHSRGGTASSRRSVPT